MRKDYFIHFVLLASCLLLGSLLLSAQSNCYTQLYDGSGYPVERHHGQLNVAACALIAAFPREYQDSFQVYDFGFYLHNEVMAEGLGGIFQKALSGIPNKSKYHLIFGKQSDRSGIFTKLWVQLNLPRSGEFSCFSNQQYNDIVHNLESTSNLDLQLGGISSYVRTEIATMQLLQGVIEDMVECCDPASALRSSECLLSYGSDGFIFVDGKKYSNGSTVYLFAGQDEVKLEPYYREGQPFGTASTTWTDNGVSLKNTGWFYKPGKEPSSSISGLIVKASQTVTRGSQNVTDEAFIRVVIVAIKYTSTSASSFAFDENDESKEEDYSSFLTTPVKGLPWKALGNNGVPEFVQAEILPAGLNKLVTYQVSDILHFGAQTTQEGSNILIQITSTTLAEADLIPYINGVKLDRGILKLISLEIKSAREIPVFLVKQLGKGSNIEFSKADLQKELNKIFHPLGFLVTVGYVESVELDFDVDLDNLFDFDLTSLEYSIVANEVESSGTIGNGGIGSALVIIGGVGPKREHTGGQADISRELAFVFKDYYKNAAHEIGHVLGLKHPWDDFPTYPNRTAKDWMPKDVNNFMEWNGLNWPKNKARKYQWTIINK